MTSLALPDTPSVAAIEGSRVRMKGLNVFSSATVDGMVGWPASRCFFAHSNFFCTVSECSTKGQQQTSKASLFGSTVFANIRFFTVYSCPQLQGWATDRKARAHKKRNIRTTLKCVWDTIMKIHTIFWYRQAEQRSYQRQKAFVRNCLQKSAHTPLCTNSDMKTPTSTTDTGKAGPC